MNQSQLVRGVVDLAVVAALSRGASHGYELARRLREAGFPDVSDASVYGTLKRLEDWGVLRAHLVESSEGPARRSFTITPHGRAWLKQSIGEWRRLVTGVDSLLGLTERKRARA